MTTPKEIEEKATAYAKSVSKNETYQMYLKLAYLKGYAQSWIDNSAIKINPMP